MFKNDVFDFGHYLFVIAPRKGKKIKEILLKKVSFLGLDEYILDVKVPTLKEYDRYIVINMLPTAEAVSAVKEVNYVLKQQQPHRLTEAEFASIY